MNNFSSFDIFIVRIINYVRNFFRFFFLNHIHTHNAVSCVRPVTNNYEKVVATNRKLKISVRQTGGLLLLSLFSNIYADGATKTQIIETKNTPRTNWENIDVKKRDNLFLFARKKKEYDR